MKQVLKKNISFLLSACIIIISVMLCPVSVQASGVMMGRVDLNLVEGSNLYLETGDSSKLIEAFKHNISIAKSVILSFNAVATGDAINYITASESVLDAIPGNLTATEEGGVVIGADLVAAIKQALIEYSQETNGFYLLPTTDYRTVPAEWFNTAPEYRTFKNIVEEKGVIVAGMHRNSMETFRFVTPFNDPDTPIELVCSNGSINNLKDKPRTIVSVYFYGFENWQSYKYRWQVFPSIDTVYHTCDVSVDYPTSNSNYVYCNSSSVNFDAANPGSWSRENSIIYSTTGEKMRVFVSASAMKNYSVGTRTVYFGKDFYDYTPADITATWDDINDRISHIDDILSQLLDKIGDTDDEDKIADLLQEILDAIKNGGGGGTGGGSGGGSESGGSSAPSGWFDEILDYLKNILKQLKSIKRWTVVNTVINGVDAIADWLDLIHDILSDVDDGMESAVATLSDALDDATGLLKSKFPFSVPWDIFFFVTLLAAEPETPYFEVPIDFDVSALDMHIHYDFVVDFSDYQYLSDICRVVLSMTYAVGLMKMTAGIVSTKKEE